MKRNCLAIFLILFIRIFAGAANGAEHTFSIGDKDFLLDKQRFQIRCGELHFARIPREYWHHRLQLCKAMGLNTVCAYLFWNYHEWQAGHFDWTEQHDAVEFCKAAQEEGLWVILRPGPYSCAEWEMGGLPWWLLKKDIKLRTRDAAFMEASRHWLQEVGRVLAPLQVSRGGPIIMVQVENEYGSFGSDTEYIKAMRQATIDAGFEVPLFQCNPTSAVKAAPVKELFQTVNFGKEPEAGFRALREVQADGPLMCSEFYPGWFDTWGEPHHTGNTAEYIKDLEYMLEHNASFSIYMAHGGTTFGMWTGADQPFKPDTSSYDYDAPISEAGWVGDKFQRTRELMQKHLLPGETLPEPGKPNAIIAIPQFEFKEQSKLLANLPVAIHDSIPRSMENYDQGRGLILYRTTLAAGSAGTLKAKSVHDFAWVSLDGKALGLMDRRKQNFGVSVPARNKKMQLDILVEAMGRVNFGKEMHDTKGIHAPVQLISPDGAAKDLLDWQIYKLPLGELSVQNLKWSAVASTEKQQSNTPSFWKGTFTLDKTGDTFLDLSSWGKGVVWVNGKCLSRFWNIGPTQTVYTPAPWLKAGANEVVILDLLGPTKAVTTGLEQPVLDKLRP